MAERQSDEDLMDATLSAYKTLFFRYIEPNPGHETIRKAVESMIKPGTPLHDDDVLSQAEERTWDRVKRQLDKWDRSRGTFRGWVGRIARGAAADVLKREIRSRKKRDQSTDIFGLGGTAEPTPEPGPGMYLSAVQIGQALVAELAKLPKDQQRAVKCVFFWLLPGLPAMEAELESFLNPAASPVRDPSRRLSRYLIAQYDHRYNRRRKGSPSPPARAKVAKDLGLTEGAVQNACRAYQFAVEAHLKVFLDQVHCQ